MPVRGACCGGGAGGKPGGVGGLVRGLGLGPNSALENSGLVMRSWGSLRKEQRVCQAHLSYFLHFIAEETEAHRPQGPGHFPKTLHPRTSPTEPRKMVNSSPLLGAPTGTGQPVFRGRVEDFGQDARPSEPQSPHRVKVFLAGRHLAELRCLYRLLYVWFPHPQM